MSDHLQASDVAERLATEFGAALSAVAGGPVEPHASSGGNGAGWLTVVSASGARDGELGIWIDRDGAVSIGRLILGGETEPDEASIVDLLREMLAQAASAVCLQPACAGLSLAVAAPAAADCPKDLTKAFALDLAGQATASFVVTGAFAEVRPAAPAPAAAAPIMSGSNLDLVLDIELPLVVRFGRAVMSVKSLSTLGPGSIVDMNRSPDDLVEVLVSDQVIARGEVVVVGGNYGVRITDLISPADRVRALEG